LPTDQAGGLVGQLGLDIGKTVDGLRNAALRSTTRFFLGFSVLTLFQVFLFLNPFCAFAGCFLEFID
jgi:hypothetical protein